MDADAGEVWTTEGAKERESVAALSRLSLYFVPIVFQSSRAIMAQQPASAGFS
jgi:hypothetical protein